MFSTEDYHIRDKHYPAFIVIFLITIILINYWSVQSFEFVNYDDDPYVTEEAHVQSGITKERNLGIHDIPYRSLASFDDAVTHGGLAVVWDESRGASLEQFNHPHY